jgi:hypothetical protein
VRTSSLAELTRDKCMALFRGPCLMKETTPIPIPSWSVQAFRQGKAARTPRLKNRPEKPKYYPCEDLQMCHHAPR